MEGSDGKIFFTAQRQSEEINENPVSAFIIVLEIFMFLIPVNKFRHAKRKADRMNMKFSGKWI